ncbi:MAG TPA: nucleoside-triphosphatase [Chloroflexota bacterium]|nr:nucleoside-triphosphatase [Chloroflexota bacterium]
MKTAYFITGGPGSGKTTLIRQVVSTMRMRAGGFYTEDLQTSGTREGFRIVTLDGQPALLARAHHPGSVQVSKYGVDLPELERVGVRALREAMERGHVMVVDEIGRMQLFSCAFRQVIQQALDGGHPVLGTLIQGRHPHADKIRRHPRAEVLTLTPDNRQEILAFLRTKFV